MESDIVYDNRLNQIAKSSRLSIKPSLISSSSMKSTESVDKNDSNYLFEHIETSEQFSVSEDSINDNEMSKSELYIAYKSLFIIEKSPQKLIRLFSSEKSKLQPSDTKSMSFDIKSVLFRLKSGYEIYKYTYSKCLRKKVTVVIEESMLKLKTCSKCLKKIPFDCIYGIVIGSETFTFKKHKAKIDELCGMLHQSSQCFSIITDTRTYDFGSTSHLALNDICIATSWLSYHYSGIRTCIPYDKCNINSVTLTLSIVKSKLNEDAKARYMSVTEMFLVIFTQLAICKTLKDKHKSYSKIFELLEKRFTYEGKLSRFMMKSLIEKFREEQNKEYLKTKVRVTLLVNKHLTGSERMNELERPLEVSKSRYDNSKLIKPMMYLAFFVPNSIRAFDKPKNNNYAKKFSRNSTIRISIPKHKQFLY